jgi:hypothetical protein
MGLAAQNIPTPIILAVIVASLLAAAVLAAGIAALLL